MFDARRGIQDCPRHGHIARGNALPPMAVMAVIVAVMAVVLKLVT